MVSILRNISHTFCSFLAADEHPKVLVQDWWKDGQTQRQVKAAVEQVLDEDLPDSYGRILFKKKSDNVFNLIVDFAVQGKKWVA